ncbi:MAG: biopolymer transporter ExbD [Neptuniibacter caesariensis]|uniref:Biopolymer transporter ExbD n=1 Tax=Neptuniibacter caesariensis TaxID=207954 RepID=A0A2G6JPB5_NEPCE|nr:MAG: biopolymer transporter ExbD [Neptuniibacter caesariensis]
MIRSRQKTEINGTLELTPLIDIIFIVVVFLLLTANTRLLTLPIDVPVSDSQLGSSKQTDTPLTISLLPEAPHYAIDKQKYHDWDDFKAILLNTIGTQKDRPLVVAADKDASVEPLLKLLALLNEQQITNTQILMKETTP